MLAIFQPYLSTIALIVAIGVNVLLLIKNAPGFSYIIANVLVLIVLPLLGFTPYDIIGEIIGAIWRGITNSGASSSITSSIKAILL